MRAVETVIAHFPEQTDTVRRLYLCDPLFRGICEDFALSVMSLHHFEARPDANLRPEISEYRIVLDELAAELRGYLDFCGRS